MFTYFLTVSSSVDVSELEAQKVPESTSKKKAYCVFYGQSTGVFLSWYVLSSD